MPGEARYHISRSETLVPHSLLMNTFETQPSFNFSKKVWKPILFRETAYGKQEVNAEDESCKGLKQKQGLRRAPNTAIGFVEILL